MDEIKQIFIDVFSNRLTTLENNYTKLEHKIVQTRKVIDETDSIIPLT
jgi:hypothetical protein